MIHNEHTPTHQRLDAYRVAIDLFRGVEAVASRFPRGYADMKDQLRRATGAIVRNIAEGANRFHPADKMARFLVARGEARLRSFRATADEPGSARPRSKWRRSSGPSPARRPLPCASWRRVSRR
jgi:hypothetical protein